MTGLVVGAALRHGASLTDIATREQQRPASTGAKVSTGHSLIVETKILGNGGHGGHAFIYVKGGVVAGNVAGAAHAGGGGDPGSPGKVGRAARQALSDRGPRQVQDSLGTWHPDYRRARPDEVRMASEEMWLFGFHRGVTVASRSQLGRPA
jgi:hypothetical protein